MVVDGSSEETKKAKTALNLALKSVRMFERLVDAKRKELEQLEVKLENRRIRYTLLRVKYGVVIKEQERLEANIARMKVASSETDQGEDSDDERPPPPPGPPPAYLAALIDMVPPFDEHGLTPSCGFPLPSPYRDFVPPSL